MADLSVQRVVANLADVRERIAAAAARAGRDPVEVGIVAAVKYLAAGDLGALEQAGIEILGENRGQDLVAKVAAWPGRFRWHFIGQLQSRKVKLIAPHVELIHSLASLSAATQLARFVHPGLRVLIEVNVAGERGKAGVAPAALDALIEACPVPVAGLMTMPPVGSENRRWFAALRELAAARGLAELSMGTSQDYEVAVEEGATLVRVGTSLYR
jgi:pyridoxal phosphate enzyme (YggS family)